MKGQYFSFDAIVGSVIFVLALITLLSAWQNVRTLLDHQTNALGLEALRVGEMILSPGSDPGDNCQKIGLTVSWKDSRLNSTKLDACRQLNPAQLKERLGTSYNVTVEFWNDEGKRIDILGNELAQINRSRIQDMARVRKIATLWNDTLKQEKMISVDVYAYR